MNAYTLSIEVRSYWHAGGGRGGGLVVDAVVHRDADGLPVLSGRHLKGLLRDALERAQAWGWFSDSPGIAARLFGQRTETIETGTIPECGCLRVSDARLPGELASWLRGEDSGLRSLLYHNLFQTAVDHATGSALNKSLRGIEVAVPLKLAAHLAPVPGREPPPDWADRLRQVLPLVDAVGAQRTRGLGRAVLTLEERP